MTYIFATKEVQIKIFADDREEAENELRDRLSLLENMDVEVPSFICFELQYAY